MAAVIWAMLMTQACLMGVARVEAGRVAAGGGLSVNNRGGEKFVTQTVLFQQNYQAFSDDNHARVLAGGQQVQLVLDQQAGHEQTTSPYYHLQWELAPACVHSRTM
jgi:hypothetical protein